MLQVDLLTDSFNQLRDDKEKFAAAFYERLFVEFPETKPLFAQTNMRRQQALLMGAIATVLKYLQTGQTDELTATLAVLGQRHVGYGVKPENYPMVGAALLDTFANFFGDQWTPELNTAWAEAYQAVASLMQPE